MTAIMEIENKVKNLTNDDLNSFRKWFYEYDNEVWDEQFENDVKVGKLDSLASQALKNFENGDSSEL
jgi:hypothetical protein